ncbi:hypothetical protein M422DRAFT_273596 [Sphaerobolus stellatus SS14]|uniref:Unplaced genomic scaffold SPHSTscaffold_339, whole genome shotgun sequence n=1 Tax=Sphaerobolus stellatus (strain SS14) TaxID=990650 RepID=A0A0C9U8V2_SPHS4|nr:hypothetical protein M422DRAFT_273596 [Sphaerobolus stellatus SS14]
MAAPRHQLKAIKDRLPYRKRLGFILDGRRVVCQGSVLAVSSTILCISITTHVRSSTSVKAVTDDTPAQIIILYNEGRILFGTGVIVGCSSARLDSIKDIPALDPTKELNIHVRSSTSAIAFIKDDSNFGTTRRLDFMDEPLWCENADVEAQNPFVVPSFILLNYFFNTGAMVDAP